MQSWCAPDDNGRLLVAEERRSDPVLMAYLGLVRNMQAAHRAKMPRVEYVPQGEIDSFKREARHEAKLDSVMMDRAKGLLAEARDMRASDIHIYIKRDYAQIRFRIDGEAVDIRKIANVVEAKELARTIYEAMSDVHEPAYMEHRMQDARIGREENLPRGVHGVRVATAPTESGSIMVLRVLYPDVKGVAQIKAGDFRPLGYSANQVLLQRKMIRDAHGINVIAGVTGSGKSTLLKYGLETIAKAEPGFHLLTVEDPPEYPIEGANQIPVASGHQGDDHYHGGYKAAVRAALRLDPDVVMIGEIRDKDTLDAAIQLAQTGQKVWTTTHANDGLTVFTRFFNMGVPREFILDAGVMKGLISQRLIPQLCKHCSLPYLGNEKYLETELVERITLLDRMAGSPGLNKIRLPRRGGCKACNHTGYQGRTVVSESIYVTQEILDLVLDQGVPIARRAFINDMHGLTLYAHAAQKMFDGVSDPESVEKICGFLEGERMRNTWTALEQDLIAGKIIDRDNARFQQVGAEQVLSPKSEDTQSEGKILAEVTETQKELETLEEMQQGGNGYDR